MNTTFTKTRLAQAVSAAAVAGLSAPAGAVVVVGGDNGWEVSFDGNVNAFYTAGDYDAGYVTGGAAPVDTARITSGFLPAFFSFTAKSPTVNGLTGTARISFAPTINNGGAKTQFSTVANTGGVPGINGATIDTREVLANISGDFGEISFGRTLSLYGRQAILNDMTLFGVGFAPGNQFGSVTFGRVGHGYTYPDFSSRVQYTSPNMNGFQFAAGMYDPSTLVGNTSLGSGYLDETDTPRFEGELTYATTFEGGRIKLGIDGTWQEVDSSCTGSTTGGALCGDITVAGWGVFGQLGFGAAEFTGYYYDGEGLGLTAQFNTFSSSINPTTGVTEESENDGFYVQGTYTFNGKTKVGVSYGESNVENHSLFGGANAATAMDTDITFDMWSVGVYHDVTSWLKLIAEYNHTEQSINGSNGGTASGTVLNAEGDTFSVGSFIFW